MAKNYLIIGGGIAGTTVAEKLRYSDPDSHITIIEQEPYRVYNKVLLPHVVMGLISPESIFLRSHEWYKAKNIQYLTSTRIKALDRVTKQITTHANEVFLYDVLILAIGGEAKLLDSVAPKNLIYTFRTYDDALRLQKGFKKSHAPIIVGGGFISLELLRIATHYGKASSLIVESNSFWPGLLHSQGEAVLAECIEKHGTKMYRNSIIEKVTPSKEVLLSSGVIVDGDMIAVGVGINSKPAWLPTDLLGLRGIKTNEYLQTADPHIYVCGDCAEFLTPSGYRYVGNWQNAVVSAVCVVKNILGHKVPYERLTSYEINFYDLVISFLGDTQLDSRDDYEDIRDVNAYVRLFYRAGKCIGLASIGHAAPSQTLQSKIVA